MQMLTREDVMTARKFPDAVACHANYIDMHDPDGGHGCEAGSGNACHPAEGDFYPDPVRQSGSGADRRAAGRGTLHLRRPCGVGLDPQSLRAVLKEQDVYL